MKNLITLIAITLVFPGHAFSKNKYYLNAEQKENLNLILERKAKSSVLAPYCKIEEHNEILNELSRKEDFLITRLDQDYKKATGKSMKSIIKDQVKVFENLIADKHRYKINPVESNPEIEMPVAQEIITATGAVGLTFISGAAIAAGAAQTAPAVAISSTTTISSTVGLGGATLAIYGSAAVGGFFIGTTIRRNLWAKPDIQPIFQKHLSLPTKMNLIKEINAVESLNNQNLEQMNATYKKFIYKIEKIKGISSSYIRDTMKGGSELNWKDGGFMGALAGNLYTVRYGHRDQLENDMSHALDKYLALIELDTTIKASQKILKNCLNRTIETSNLTQTEDISGGHRSHTKENRATFNDEDVIEVRSN